MKIEQELVQRVIFEQIQDPHQAEALFQQIIARHREEQALIEERDATRESQREKRNIVLLLCSEEDLPQATELANRSTAISLQIEQERNHNEVVEAILRGAASYNEGKKETKKVRTLAEACGVLSPKKHLEGFPKKIHTKEPALIIASTNLTISEATQHTQEGGP